jgi:aromatic ring-cleaving dioxygenase
MTWEKAIFPTFMSRDPAGNRVQVQIVSSHPNTVDPYPKQFMKLTVPFVETVLGGPAAPQPA